MTKHFLPALATLAMLAGCTANVNGSITPGTPGATTGTTGATGSTSTSTTVTTGLTTGALNDLYKVGRVWEYEITSAGTTSTMKREVTALNGSKATVKTTVTVLGKDSSSTADVDLSNADAASTLTTDANTVISLSGNPTAESLTVKAGTFDTMHGKGTSTSTASGSTVKSDFEYWTSAKAGPVKQITTTKLDIPNIPSIPAGSLPSGINIPGLPSGGSAGGSGDIVTTLELVKFQ